MSKTFHVAVLMLLVVMWSQTSMADDRWSQFRGPGSRGISDQDGLPIRWSTTENVDWVTDIPGLGWSSPIVWDDTVYLTTVVSFVAIEEPRSGLYSGRTSWAPSRSEHRWLVYAIDVETGVVKWEREVYRSVPTVAHHPKNTLASETPVTDGESVYVYFGHVGVFCLDADGTLKWSYEIKASDTRLGWGTAASPVLHRDHLYIVNDNDNQSYLLALDKRTGEEVWRVNRDEGTNWSTPYIWENELRTEIITTGTDKVRSYGLDGSLLWELTGLSSITVPTPFAEFGVLYLSSGYVGDQERPVFAIRPGASGDISLGEAELSNEFVVWSQPQAAPYNTSPIVYGDYYYTLFDRGFLSCHDAHTGEEIYGRQRIQAGAAFTSSPWAYSGNIFALSEDGDTYVIRAGPTFELIRLNSLSEFTMSTPAIAHRSLFIRTASRLYRITELDPAGRGLRGSDKVP